MLSLFILSGFLGSLLFVIHGFFFDTLLKAVAKHREYLIFQLRVASLEHDGHITLAVSPLYLLVQTIPSLSPTAILKALPLTNAGILFHHSSQVSRRAVLFPCDVLR